MTYQDEAEFNQLLAIYKELAPKQVVEIGSLTGETLKRWIANAETGATIVSVDRGCLPNRTMAGGRGRILDTRCAGRGPQATTAAYAT